MEQVSGPETKSDEFSWSVLDGSYEKGGALLDTQNIRSISIHMRNSASVIKVYMPVLYAIELSNPELVSYEAQKVEVERSIINAANILNPDDYQDGPLAKLREAVPEFEENPPPAMVALSDIFEAVEELEEKEGRDRDVTSKIKARAFGAVRLLYLLQTGQSHKLPIKRK